MELTKIQQEVKPIKVIPGRGLVTHMGTQLRKEYLNQLGYSISNLETTTLKLVEIQKNIESYIGTVEVPVGVVGPLIWNKENNENTGNHDNSETVFAPIGTLEGALVASMNRGARAISLSGGFQSEVKWQRMSRAPMFEFENSAQTQLFVEFIGEYFTRIKQKAESYSNHASLEKIDIIQDDIRVHTVFFYQTGDASGQNMTTTCTWHAMLFIIDEFYTLHGIQCVNYILEGNGSSDKKISEYNQIQGRGIHVEATAVIQEKYIREVLRTTSQKMLHVFGPSKALALKNGMVGYSINAANAVASIFVATGQDLACIHESSVAFLDLLPHNDGMLAKITFTNLVVGTVGGGTHLPKQSEALELMGCKGNGKSSRFASLIAGFALGLELSTYAAIVSGEFAKAHEKLGRNRPVEWLTRNEVNTSFLLSILKHPLKERIKEISMEDAPCTEDGILTHIAARATKKLIGFEEVVLKFETSLPNTNSGHSQQEGSSIIVNEERILLKSKATDTEVIKGLHLISASIDSTLSDLISQYRETLEYKNSHLKEGIIYEFLHANGYPFIPNFYGSYRNDEREAHILCLEFLLEKDMFIFNSENHPEHWNRNAIQWAISDIGVAHRLLKQMDQNSKSNSEIIQEFKPWENNQLYNQIIRILQQQNDESLKTVQLERFVDAGLQLETRSHQLSMIPKTIIHNDFNSRNVAVRLNGDVIVYDWELSVIGFPHRDVVELLSFTLDLKKNIPDWLSYLEFHFQDSKQLWANLEADEFLEFRKQWFFTYEYALIELIATRLIFYEVAGIVVKYEFSNRVLQTAVWILDQVQEYNRQFKK